MAVAGASYRERTSNLCVNENRWFWVRQSWPWKWRWDANFERRSARGICEQVVGRPVRPPWPCPGQCGQPWTGWSWPSRTVVWTTAPHT